jgi:hypothetical protein
MEIVLGSRFFSYPIGQYSPGKTAIGYLFLPMNIFKAQASKSKSKTTGKAF